MHDPNIPLFTRVRLDGNEKPRYLFIIMTALLSSALYLKKT